MSFRTDKKSRKPYPVHSWSPQLPFNKDNISKVPDKAGVYVFYDKNQKPIHDKPIYAGVSKNGNASGLRHRIQSYGEKDDPKVHPTKVPLRRHIHSFRFKVVPIDEARKIEHELKQETKYNADNPMNEAKKHKS